MKCYHAIAARDVAIGMMVIVSRGVVVAVPCETDAFHSSGVSRSGVVYGQVKRNHAVAALGVDIGV